MSMRGFIVGLFLYVSGDIGVGAGGCSPPDSGKLIYFWGRSQQPKMKKKFVLYLLNEKFILSSEIKCPKSEIFTNNYWVG